MARVDVTLNGRIYPIACDDGQEGRVRDMAAYVDRKLAEVSAAAQTATDMHQLVMVALLVADELFDARATAEGWGGAGVADGQAEAALVDEEVVDAALEHLAQRMEALAASLEQS